MLINCLTILIIDSRSLCSHVSGSSLHSPLPSIAGKINSTRLAKRDRDQDHMHSYMLASAPLAIMSESPGICDRTIYSISESSGH